MNDTLILISLLFLSGAFSGSETALTAVSLARAKALREDGQGGSKALLYLKEHSTSMLITLLIGNNLVNIGASAFATVVATEYLGALGPGVAVGVLTFLILVFGEITPKKPRHPSFCKGLFGSSSHRVAFNADTVSPCLGV